MGIELREDDWRDFTASFAVEKDGREYWLEIVGREFGSGDETWQADISDAESGEWLEVVTDRDRWPDYLPRLHWDNHKQVELWNQGDES